MLECGANQTVRAVGGFHAFVAFGPTVGYNAVKGATAVDVANRDSDAAGGGSLSVVFACGCDLGGIAGVPHARDDAGAGAGCFGTALGMIR